MALTLYDKAKWHYGSADFPADVLPLECGATHIAFFLRWCLENGLLNKSVTDEFAAELTAVERGELSVRRFFMETLDGVLTSEELNAEGRKFANAYYKSEKTKFARAHGYYLTDYDELTLRYIREPYTRDNWYFFFEYSEENYLLVKAVIDRRYAEFKEMK